MAGFLPVRSELFPWLKDAFLDEFRQHHMNWLRISAFISVAFPRKLHPETVLCHARMSDPIFSWETHSTFKSRISIWFFYRAHKTLKSNWNNILEKYHCCWKWRRRERGTSLNSKNFLRCVVALDFQPLLASAVNLDLALEDEQILKYRQICQKVEDKSLAASNRMWMDCLPAFQSMQPISKPHFDSPADTRSDHPTFWETNDAAVSIHQPQRWRMYVYSDVIN